MGFNGFLAVGIGAAVGAWLRWWLSFMLNAILPTLPLGTLVANLMGGYLMGLVMGMFTLTSTFSPEVRLFVMTGFLGGLTTFSTFSAEAITLLSRGQYGCGQTGESTQNSSIPTALYAALGRCGNYGSNLCRDTI